jgi:hypothetical protein
MVTMIRKGAGITKPKPSAIAWQAGEAQTLQTNL